MLVSHQHRFIYTKTIKTAGTSVESYFERFCMPAEEWEQSEHRESYESEHGIVGYRGPRGQAKKQAYKWWNHMPARQIRDLLGEATWLSYFKFCVVRNPYDKAISAFEFSGADFQFAPPPGSDLEQAGRGLDTEQRRFLYWLVVSKPPYDRRNYTIDRSFCMDFVIRFESLQDDVQMVCRRLGLPWEPDKFPRFKAKIRREEFTVERLYSEPARKFIEWYYQYEIRKFGYRFPAGP